MAFRKTLAQRLFNISKISTQALKTCCISSPSVATRIPPDYNRTNIAPDPGDDGIFRRFLHKRAIFHPVIGSDLRPFPMGENLMEKLKSLGTVRDRVRLDGLSPPERNSVAPATGLTVDDARKLLRMAQLETVKSRLRGIEKNWLTYTELVRICGEGCSDPDQGLRWAKMLDESGTVIVLGDVVFLRPEQVAKAIQCLIPIPGANPNDQQRKELEEMEQHKAAIDSKARTLVHRELQFGLGFLVLQTIAFMRLTFWELSWDVMEPICYFVTSAYFMASYVFFLRTSKEPSFEGFFQSRFIAKQKRLMKLHNFDIGRYNELRKACYPSSPPVSNHLEDRIHGSLLFGN